TQASNVDARIAGAEAGAEFALGQGWKLGGTLAYAWGENRTDGGALPQMPPLEARLSAGWEGAR
ncbi:TonB-dependent receptor, partial [Mycobacterium tuberculosis]|nr:TonB-dependent receptor [Mycobacterium tuberculosis]